jgi:hypothetical protein
MAKMNGIHRCSLEKSRSPLSLNLVNDFDSLPERTLKRQRTGSLSEASGSILVTYVGELFSQFPCIGSGLSLHSFVKQLNECSADVIVDDCNHLPRLRRSYLDVLFVLVSLIGN